MSQAGKQVADGVTQLIQGQRDIDKAETEYQSKLAEFNAQKPEAERKISEAERQITLAEEKIDNLTVPAYSVSDRREGLTSQGYCVYMVIEGIVAKLADIFPIFLYFVAALVTFSTMGRMVDEERTNSGTLKALGYGNADVMLKFTVYGFAASTWAHASACSPATRCCRLSSPTHTARDSPCRTSCSNSTPGSPWPHSHLHG